jgi:hypothetical protein
MDGMDTAMGIKERAAERRKRMVGHMAKNFKEAEEWAFEQDSDFWQSFTPEERISVQIAITRAADRQIRKIMAAQAQRDAAGTKRRRSASLVL